jgi:hypothetical protein
MSNEKSHSGRKSIVRKLLPVVITSLVFVIDCFLLTLSFFLLFSEYTQEKVKVRWHLLDGFASVIYLALLSGGITIAVT